MKESGGGVNKYQWIWLSFDVCTLIEKMTHIWGVLKLVKKSHLFRGHVDPLFRCPKSNFSQKWASYKNLTTFAWESDTHKWSIFKVIRGVRESIDTRNLIDGCHDTLRIIPEKRCCDTSKRFQTPFESPRKRCCGTSKRFQTPFESPRKRYCDT